jgi:hypothetical protein
LCRWHEELGMSSYECVKALQRVHAHLAKKTVNVLHGCSANPDRLETLFEFIQNAKNVYFDATAVSVAYETSPYKHPYKTSL